MKIKRCKAIIAALLAAVLSAGCADTEKEPQISPSDSTEQSVTSVETTEPPEVAEPVDIADFTVPYGEGLRSLEINADLFYPSGDNSDGLILSGLFSEAGYTLQLTDLSTMEISSAVISTDDEFISEYTFFLVNGFPISARYSDSTVTVYDRSFNELHSESFGISDSFFRLMGDTLAIADNSGTNRIVTITPDSSGKLESKEIYPKFSENLSLSYVVGAVGKGEYLICYYDEDTYDFFYGVLSESSGEVTPLRILDNEYVSAADGKIIVSQYNSTQTVIFDPELPTIKKVLETPVGTMLVNSDGSSDSLYFYGSRASDEGDKSVLELYRYDAESGRLTAQLKADFPDSFAYISNVCEYGEYVILNTECGAYFSKLIVWKPQDAAEHRGYDALSGADYSAENHALAQRISEKYSVEVFYGADGVRHFNDYAVVSETDEKLINNALITLDGFFGKFPAGFFDELVGKFSGYNELCVYLTGRIIPNLNESGSINDAVAFVTTENDIRMMVLDITQGSGIEKNAAHELMHIIENAVYCIDFDSAAWRDKECFARWDMLNPEDFSYYFRYTDEYGVTLGYDAVEYNGALYYDGCGTDVNSIYFVDGYSMTFPSEDRARIFENIATASADMLPSYFKGSAMQLKAAYLCACIRDSFECITDDTVLFWESCINPAYTLSYFRENYDLDAYYANAVG